MDCRVQPTAVRFAEIGCETGVWSQLELVMPVLVTGIHVFPEPERGAWMAGTSPAMTDRKWPSRWSSVS
jgi:hypothetical protein